MTYQTAYKLLVAAYKSAKGIMPEGLDLLKIKQKARQKVIDSTKGKILQFPKERITDWTKARPQPPKIEMKDGIQTTRGLGDLFKRQMEKIGQKAKQESKPKSKKLEDAMESFFGFKPRRETEAEMLKRMNRQNKESVARLKEKKEKSLGEKLKDYDGDPDAMAGGGKVKKPFRSKVVDFLGGPSVVGAELGLSGLLEVYNLLGMPLMKDGGIMELAVGGIANISDTYDNNPTLQSQYPNKQDYLDLFSSQTTTTTPEVAAIPETTTSTIAPINPIKPIIPIPQSSGDSGGITTIQPRAPKEDLTFRERMANLNLQMGVPVEEEEKSFFDKIKEFSPTYQFMKAGKQKLEDFFEARAREKAIKEAQEKARLADELAKQMNAVYYDNSGADFTGGRYDGASSRSEYESNPTGFSGSS